MRRFAAQHLLPREGRHIQLVPRQVHRKGRRGGIAERQTRAVSGDRIAIGHAHAGGGAVPCEADVVVIVQRGHVDDLAVFGGVNLRFDFQLFDHIGDPACAEGFPSNHLSRAFAQERPHGHLECAGVRGGHDADAVIRRHAEHLAGGLDCLKQLGLAGCGTVAAAQWCVRQLGQIECGDFGAGAGRETRICRYGNRFRVRARCRLCNSHLCYPLR